LTPKQVFSAESSSSLPEASVQRVQVRPKMLPEGAAANFPLGAMLVIAALGVDMIVNAPTAPAFSLEARNAAMARDRVMRMRWVPGGGEGTENRGAEYRCRISAALARSAADFRHGENPTIGLGRHTRAV
jgi:hypothetical protein